MSSTGGGEGGGGGGVRALLYPLVIDNSGTSSGGGSVRSSKHSSPSGRSGGTPSSSSKKRNTQPQLLSSRTSTGSPRSGRKSSDSQDVMLLSGGVSINGLRAILRHIQNDRTEADRMDWTTEQVNELVIKEWTRKDQCSLVSLFLREHKQEPFPALGTVYDDMFHPKANRFVSHAWRCKFSDLVSTLDQYCEREQVSSSLLPSGHPDEPIYFWFDLLLNSQWNDESKAKPFDWWSRNFQYSIKTIGHTLVILAPWENPIPLTRSWCLWEIHCTICTSEQNGLEFLMPHAEAESLRSAFAAKGCVEVIKSLSKIDVKKSEARADDKILIDAAIEASTGFAEIQIEIQERLWRWAIDTLASDMPLGQGQTQEMVDYQLDLANLLQKRGRAVDALHRYEVALKHQEVLCGRAHKKTMKLLGMLARSQKKLQCLPEALANFSECLAYWSSVGDEDSSLLTKRFIADIHQKLERFDESKQLFQEVLEGRMRIAAASPSNGKIQRELFKTYTDYGQLLMRMDQDQEAEEFITKAYDGFCTLAQDSPPPAPSLVSSPASSSSSFSRSSSSSSSSSTPPPSPADNSKEKTELKQELLHSQHFLGVILDKRGKFVDAADHFDAAFSGRSAYLGLHEDAMKSLISLLDVLSDSKKLNNPAEALRRAKIFLQRRKSVRRIVGSNFAKGSTVGGAGGESVAGGGVGDLSSSVNSPQQQTSRESFDSIRANSDPTSRANSDPSSPLTQIRRTDSFIGQPLLLDEELGGMSTRAKVFWHQIEHTYAVLLQNKVDAEAAGSGDGGGIGGQQLEVERFFKAAYEGMMKVHGEEGPITLKYLESLADCYGKEGGAVTFEDALFYYESVLELRELYHPSDTLAIAKIHCRLGEVHLELVNNGYLEGEYLGKAAFYFQEALLQEGAMDDKLITFIKTTLADVHGRQEAAFTDV